MGIKEQKKARNDAEPTPKSVDRHDARYEDKLNREAEKVADTKSCSQSWVLETGISHNTGGSRNIWEQLE